MTYEELEHAIRASCDVAQDDEVIVFGSQAILGQFPDAHEDLRQSAEADIMPKNRPERTDAIDGAIGENSLFHQTHGFYVHGVSIDAATLPTGWQLRTVPIRTTGTAGKTGHCLESHDLAASKLVAYREKDRDFVRVLLRERYLKPRKLIERLRKLPVTEADRERLVRWVDITMRDLG
jgi:hypothetical protein